MLFDLSTFPNLLNANKKCQYSSIHLYLLNAQLSHLAKLKKSSVSFFSPPFPHSPHFYCFSRVCDLYNAAWWNEIFFLSSDSEQKASWEWVSLFSREVGWERQGNLSTDSVHSVHRIKMVLVSNFDLTYVTWVLCTVFPFSWKKERAVDWLYRTDADVHLHTSMSSSKMFIHSKKYHNTPLLSSQSSEMKGMCIDWLNSFRHI